MMSAASPLIRNEVAFIGAYAPFSSMSTFAQDIASATRSGDNGREPWKVDQLTRKVFVHSVTAWLEPREAQILQDAYSTLTPAGSVDPSGLSPDGRCRAWRASWASSSWRSTRCSGWQWKDSNRTRMTRTGRIYAERHTHHEGHQVPQRNERESFVFLRVLRGESSLFAPRTGDSCPVQFTLLPQS